VQVVDAPAGSRDLPLEDQGIDGVEGPREAIAPPGEHGPGTWIRRDEPKERGEARARQVGAADAVVGEDLADGRAAGGGPGLELGALVVAARVLAVGAGAHVGHEPG